MIATYHLFSQDKSNLLLPGRCVDPTCGSAISHHIGCSQLTLKLGLSGDGVTVDLITSSDHTVHRLSVVSEDHVLP